jgi:hypothetical protein
MRIAIISAFIATVTACSAEPRRPVGSTCGDDAECESGLCLFGQCLDPAGDEDLDGLVNALEGSLESNPLNRDTDADGVLDGDELDGASARDTDGDGFADILESRVDDADSDCLPDELDADDMAPANDLKSAALLLCGTTGVCREFPGGISVSCGSNKKPICDYSGIAQYQADEVACDGLDNDCDGRSDEGAPDLDGDATADCVDTDIDGDGVVNDDDICPAVSNASQEDADVDGVGDACDAPSVPVLAGFTPTSPTNALSVTAAGSGEPFASVSLFPDDACADPIGEATVGPEGTWAATVEVSAGLNVFWLQARNRAGLLSACEAAELTLEVDQIPPAPVEVSSLVPLRWDDGAVRYELAGETETGATLRWFSDPNCTKQVAEPNTARNGEFDIEIDILKGTSELFATVTDVAGNVSECSRVAGIFGTLTVEVGSRFGPSGEVAVQFHFPDGSLAGNPLWTGSDGRVSIEGFNGFGVTVASLLSQGYREYASVLGLEPGEVARVAQTVFDFVEDFSLNLSLTFPPAPAGTSWIKAMAPCGYHYVSAGEGTTSGRIVFGASCVPSDTFDIAIIAMDAAGEPLAFLVKSGSPIPSPNGGSVIFQGPWSTNGFLENQATIITGDAGVQARLSSSWFSLGAILENDDSSQVSGFIPARTEGRLTLRTPPIPALTARWTIEVPHLGVSGRGVVGSVGTSIAPFGLSFDVELDSMPKLYGISSESEPNLPMPATYHWTADGGLERADDLRFSTSFYGTDGYLRWFFVVRPSRRNIVAAPKVHPEFPNAWFFKGVYFAMPDFIVARDAVEARGLYDMLELCPAGAECGHEAYGDSDFTSCCGGDGATER